MTAGMITVRSIPRPRREKNSDLFLFKVQMQRGVIECGGAGPDPARGRVR